MIYFNIPHNTITELISDINEKLMITNNEED